MYQRVEGYLAALILLDGELLIVATTEVPETAIATYGRRWEIECLFGCFKGRGFTFEDTHITDKTRIKKRSNNQRKTNQEMEPTVENKPYRAKQSTVA